MILFSNLCPMIQLIAKSLASLLNHVVHIVLLCSKEQMIWTNT